MAPHDVLQVLADGLLITQVVMFLHQTVEQRLIASAPHLLDLDRQEPLQSVFDWSRIDQDGGGLPASRQGIQRTLPHGR